MTSDFAVIPIQLIGQPCLRVVTQQADISDVTGLWNIMLSMINVLNVIQTKSEQPIGVGLSAPQIGLPVQAFLIYNASLNSNTPYQFFINPAIIANGVATWWDSHTQESCLSIPNNGAETWQSDASLNRLTSFTITYQTFCVNNGTATAPNYAALPLSTSLGALPSGVSIQQLSFGNTKTDNEELNWMLQHEVDHLKGILYTDYMGQGTNGNLYLNCQNTPPNTLLYIAQQNGVQTAPQYTCAINENLSEIAAACNLSSYQAGLVLGNLLATSLPTSN